MTMVSLTFDDALDAHLDAAMPILEGVGLRGTFFVNINSDCFASRHREWAAAAANGHELGNHSVFHPGVSTKRWVTEGIALEHYTLDRMRHELMVASQILTMLDGRVERTFAFPCSNPWLGEAGWPRRLLTKLGLDRTRIMGWVDKYGLDVGSKRVDYTPLVRELFPAARCGGIEIGDLPVQPPDRHRVRGVTGDGLDIAGLMAAVDEAAARNAWLILVFHGIGGGHHLSCDVDAFRELTQRLASDGRVEVVTFLEGAQRCWGGANRDD